MHTLKFKDNLDSVSNSARSVFSITLTDPTPLLRVVIHSLIVTISPDSLNDSLSSGFSNVSTAPIIKAGRIQNKRKIRW